MSIVADAVSTELKAALAISKKYITAIETAKTKAKTVYFKRKLKKNNKIVANLLIGIDNIEKVQYNTKNRLK